MDLNKIKSFKKEELLQKLRQRGFNEVVEILEDKNIDGESFIELREFEIFKWRLNKIQKKALWDCISQIRDKPHTLLIQEPRKSFSITKKTSEDSDPDKVFRGKLQNILGAPGMSIGRAPTLQKIAKPQPPLGASETRSYGKPLPSTPPPSPPLRNGAIKNLPGVVKKAAPPLPKEVAPLEPDNTYLHMHAPIQSDDKCIGDYLTPVELSWTQNRMQKSPKIRVPGDGNSKNLKTADMNKFRPTSVATTNKRFSKESPLVQYSSDDKTYETVDKIYEASPEICPNSPMNIPTSSKFFLPTPTEEEKKFATQNTSPKTSIKDLNSGAIVIEDSNTLQQDVLSLVSSIFSPFKSKTKPKTINDQPLVNKPLPNVPIPQEERSNLFRKPIAPPRTVTPDPNPEANYIELTNQINKPLIPQRFNHSNEALRPYNNSHEIDEDLYQNTPQIQDPYEKEDFYEKTLNVEEPIYENISDIRGSIRPSISKSKQFIDTPSIKHNLFKKEQSTENTVNINPSLKYKTPKIDLVLLLSEKFKEREKMKTVVIESDSEFSDETEDEPFYGNISNDNEHDSTPEVTNLTSHETKKKIPIYETALPEIPIPYLDKKDSPPVKRTEFPKGPSTITSSAGPVAALQHMKQLPIAPAENYKNIPSTAAFTTTPNKQLPNTHLLGRISSFPSTGSRNYELHNMKLTASGNNSQLEADRRQEEPKDDDKSKINNIFDLNEEPFYRNINRKESKQLLSNCVNGAFLFRPSRSFFLVLTVKHDKIYNLGIQKTPNNKLLLSTEGDVQAPEFESLREFVDYFSTEPITFHNNGQIIEIHLTTHASPS